MKALCVYSGGLDSILAAELIRAQGIEVLALFFETPFFTSGKAGKSARKMGLSFKEVPIYFKEREFGASKMSFGIQIEAALRVWSLLWQYRDL